MEFSFDINTVLPHEITIVNGDYRILNHGQTARILTTDKLTSIIDAVGEASYKAQGLPSAVTNARKFRISDHRLYIVKNAEDNKNLGTVVGILKVGTKHLFVHDSHGQVHERTPLCVLDFYVHESKQRSGYGKKLFDAMLEFEKCNAYELAIDRPSNKCLAFLQKHFNMATPIRQVNNFVVFSAFFNRSLISHSRLSAGSRQKIDRNLPNDNVHRQEYTSWLLPSEKQQQNRRPFSEQNDLYRSNRLRVLPDENGLSNARKPPIHPSVNDDKKPLTAFTTSYGQHYNHNSILREQTKTHGSSAQPSQIARTYTELFSENNPFPSLRRYNTNPLIGNDKHTIPNPPMNYTYKDYQMSTIHNTRQCSDGSSQAEPLTSIYTFPSLMKPNNNWRKTHQQNSTIDASSSAWRIFSGKRVLN